MMHDHKFALVEFNDTQLLTLHDGMTAHVAIKPIVDSFGIDWPTQLRKIKADAVLSKGMGLKPIPSERGPQETVTLPLDLLQGWLFKLNPDKVKPEARERVIAYQRECYRVLHDYWMKGAAINPRANAGHIGNTDTILKLTKAIQSEKSEHVRDLMHKLLQQECEQRGIIAPEVAEIGGPNTGQWQITFNRFRAALNLLIGAGELVDLHRRDDRMALNLPDLAKLARKHRIDMPPLTEIYDCLRAWPGLVSQGDVNCSDGKVRHCWVISLRGVADLFDEPA